MSTYVPLFIFALHEWLPGRAYTSKDIFTKSPTRCQCLGVQKRSRIWKEKIHQMLNTLFWLQSRREVSVLSVQPVYKGCVCVRACVRVCVRARVCEWT